MQPTRTFFPFGEDGPRIALYGRSAGDFSPLAFQDPRWQSNTGLYFRVDGILKHHRVENLLMPDPRACTTDICSRSSFSNRIQPKEPTDPAWFYGANADGVLLPHEHSAAIASGDCPTIVAHCRATKDTVVAHAGIKSLVDQNSVRGIEPLRPKASVVDSLVEIMRSRTAKRIEVFVTCGISMASYQHSDFATYIRATYGDNCVYGDHVDLGKIIVQQFLGHGVEHVLLDGVDTFADRDATGEPVWHSYRRTRKPDRNFVLVVNH